MQAILNHITDDHIYEFSSMVDSFSSMENKNSSDIPQESNVLDRIDGLLNVLNEPNYSLETNQTKNDAFTALLSAADSCLTDDKSSSTPP